MITLTKIKLQNDERGCWRNTAKNTKKKRDKRQQKDAKKLTKKRQDNWWGLHRVKMLKYPLERSKNPQNATG